MIVDHLKPDEVGHDLTIRNITGIIGLADQRRALKNFLKERTNPEDTVVPRMLDIDKSRRIFDL